MITYEDLEKFYERSFGDEKYQISYLLDNWDDKDVQDHIKYCEKVVGKAKQLLGKIIDNKSYYLDEKDLKNRIVSMDIERVYDDLYPIPVYISAGDPMTIGLLLHEGGELEMFEGNDEATDETIALINKLLHGEEDRYEKIYASHGIDLVEQIVENNMLPKNLYVSPSREHASGYWSLSEERVLFSGEVNMNDISQESDYDWKTIRETEIKNIRML